jgi:hypothetical protein
MYNERQTEILTQITHGLDLPADMASEVRVVQTPGCIDSVVETHDFATALMGAIGQAVAAVGERRDLGAQRVTVDRRHAGLLFNEIAYFFQCGWQFDISAVHTPVNGFYPTRDDRHIFFNGESTSRRRPETGRRPGTLPSETTWPGSNPRKDSGPPRNHPATASES